MAPLFWFLLRTPNAVFAIHLLRVELLFFIEAFNLKDIGNNRKNSRNEYPRENQR